MTQSYSIDFREPNTANELAGYIGIDPDRLQKIVESPTREEFYLKHRIMKRSLHRLLKPRIVWESHRSLASAHKSLARRFELFARWADSRFPHSAAHGYIRKRGTKSNATVHCNAPFLLRADISDFFPSISITRLERKFIELGMKKEPAQILAKFVTIHDCLPLGLHASPMLANLICLDLDEKIQSLADKYNCKYTRYADDISLSGSIVPSRAELKEIIEGEGFRFADEKCRITKKGQAHYVTGLSISDSVPHVPKSMKRRLRQELYYCEKFGIEEHIDRSDYLPGEYGLNQLDGKVRYISHIEPNGAEIRSKWQALLERDELEPSYESLRKHHFKPVTCFIDESGFSFRGKEYLALGLVFTEYSDEITTSTVATLRDHEVDPFAAGDKAALKKKGLHFVDSHPDLRTSYIKLLAGLPYRCFVVFGELTNPGEYQNLYYSLLRKILPHRLMYYDGAQVDFIYEENSSIKFSAVEQAVTDIYLSLEKTNNRRPFKCPQVKVGKKSEYPIFAVPDYLLAVFGRYMLFPDNTKENIRIMQFERLRDQYRLILNADSGMEYSRRNPISYDLLAR